MGSFTVLHKVVVGNRLLLKMRLKIRHQLGLALRPEVPHPGPAHPQRLLLLCWPCSVGPHPLPSTLSNDLNLGRAGGIAARDVEFELYVRGERGPLLLCWN